MMEMCKWCGREHGPLCPFVKAISFDDHQTVTRVEFRDAGDAYEMFNFLIFGLEPIKVQDQQK